MKKCFIILIFMIFVSSNVFVSAAATKKSPYYYQINTAIAKYKKGNYVGCLQDMQNVIAKDPSNDVAHYYMAISSVKIGSKDNAIKEYNKVISLNKNKMLVEYAQQGLDILTLSPDQLKATKQVNTIKKEVTNAVNGATQAKGAAEVQQEIERQNLNRVKSLINSGTDVNNQEINKFKDYTPGNKLNQNIDNPVTPSNDEIANAVKVLAKLGINPMSQLGSMPGLTNNYTDPTTASYSMLMGNSGNNNNNNNIMNMLPMLMNGQNGSQSNAEAIQAMIMSSMLQNSFDMGGNNNN